MATALERIYNDLQECKTYGEFYFDMRFPVFQDRLYLTSGGYIGWTNYGSSAIENTLEGLEWVIKNIFGTTPEKFLAKYDRDDKYDELEDVMSKQSKVDIFDAWSKNEIHNWNWNFFCEDEHGKPNYVKVKADNAGEALEMCMAKAREEAGCELVRYKLFKVINPV